MRRATWAFVAALAAAVRVAAAVPEPAAPRSAPRPPASSTSTRTAPAASAASPSVAPVASTRAAPTASVSSAIVRKLRSSDEGQVRAGIDEVRAAGAAAKGGAGAREIAALLERGATLELTCAALDALGDVDAEGWAETLAGYLAHKSAPVRMAAARAIGRARGDRAASPLRRALADRDARVRELAATALAGLKARDAVPDLFIAFERRVGAAAFALGRLCAGAECDRLIGAVGPRPLDDVKAGLDELLARADAGVSDDAKVKAVQRVRAIAGPDANRFLLDVQKRWPKDGAPRVKQAIDQAVLATGGAGAP